MNLSTISPFGPIFGKELRSTARRKRSYFLRVGYLGFLLLFLVMVWSTFSYPGYGGGVAWRQQRQAELGLAFFIAFSLFCVGAMGLIGPVLTATAVNSERLHRTLHVLLMTPINNWQIITSKLLSRMLIALTLIGLSLPVLALVRLLGGVELTQMFGVICLACVAALTGASIGLLFSTLLKRGYAVILLSYGVMGFLYVFLPMVAGFILSEMNGISSRFMGQLFSTFNPFLCASLLMQGTSIQYAAWEWCVVVHVIFSSLLVVLSAVLLRRISRRENEGAPVVLPPLPVAAVEKLAVDDVVLSAVVPSSPDRETASGTRNVSDNPVLWRELRQPLMSRNWQRIATTVTCIGLLLITYGMFASLPNALKDPDLQIGYSWVFNVLIMLIACVISATAIAHEKEGDTWMLLLTTPLSGREIISAKFIGVTRRMLWPMVLVAGHFGIFTLFQVIPLSMFLITLWIIITFNLLWIATGILLSLCIRKVTFAVVLNLLLPIVIYGVTPILLLILGELAWGDDDAPEFILYFLPYFYLGMGFDAVDQGGGYRDRVYMPFNE